MAPFYVDLRAPFAAFRWLQAGVYRATSPVIPPSAAYGLVLNLAGIEVRGPMTDETTGSRPEAPALELAVGRVGPPPVVCTLYQQLHSYPVGTSGARLKERVRGQKYWIAPTRREILVRWHGVVAVRGNAGLVDRVRSGLRGEADDVRYGLPFAGDNNCLLDRADVYEEAPEATWYERWDGVGQRPGSCRLTVNIDRADASGTETPLFAPLSRPGRVVPDGAWVRVGPRSRRDPADACT